MVAWIVGVALSVAAEPSYLESPPLATRPDAVARLDIVQRAGCDGRIVRRFVQGQGWRFVVRLDADPAPSQACGAALVGRGTAPRPVEEDAEEIDDPPLEDDAPLDGDTVAEEVDVPDEPLALPPVPEAEVRPTARRDAIVRPEEVLARLLRRHRGLREPAPLGDLVFRFRRRTPDGRVIDHLYARRGDDVYLAVDVVEGSGRDSRAGLVGGCAWYDGDTTHPLDVESARAAFERFAPESVLALSTSMLGTRPDLPEPSLVRVERPAGESIVRLAAPGDRATPPVRLDVAIPGWRLVSVERGPVESSVRTTYDEWFELDGGALLPRRVRVTRGTALLDDIIVDAVETAATWLPEWFPDCGS